MKLSVYVNEDTRARFKATCAMQKVSMNQVVNRLLEDDDIQELISCYNLEK